MRPTDHISTREYDRVQDALRVHAELGRERVTLERLSEQSGLAPRRVERVLGRLETRADPPVERVGGRGTTVAWKLYP